MTARSTVGRALAGAAILALSACASRPEPPPPAAPFVLPSTAAALAPAVYMALASSSSLFAIRASELAAQRGSSRTRGVARTIIQDQTGVAAQLSMAGRRIDLLPSAALSDSQSAELERLGQSRDFDRDYRRAVGDALARSLEAHRAFARAGTSPTLKPVAEMAAPVTRKNLDAIRR